MFHIPLNHFASAKQIWQFVCWRLNTQALLTVNSTVQLQQQKMQKIKREKSFDFDLFVSSFDMRIAKKKKPLNFCVWSWSWSESQPDFNVYRISLFFSHKKSKIHELQQHWLRTNWVIRNRFYFLKKKKILFNSLPNAPTKWPMLCIHPSIHPSIYVT